MSRRKLDVARDAAKALADLPAKHFKQVVVKTLALIAEPFPHDSRPLQGHEGLFRIDSGECGIVYSVDDELVRIFVIGKRNNDDEVYRLLDRKT
ncbi:MAG: type II toxin-antitoxin system RelE/ParE family toxin [Roseiarcus sp.]|jgi:mRNA-degrading endonuclease RelE of RelBE toxin-antitoxin system